MCEKEASMCVSIVLTTYNDEDTISAVLNSIYTLGLDLNHIELIIVDGGSTDKTLSIINDFLSNNAIYFKRNLLIVHDKNYGISRARNDGIREARCPYVLILDSDILLPSNALKTMLQYLISARKTKKVVGVRPLIDTAPFIFKVIAQGKIHRKNLGACEAFLASTEILMKNMYDETMGPPHSSDEDIELGARLLKQGLEIHMLGFITAHHIKSPQSLYVTTSRSKKEYLIKILKIIRSYYTPYVKYGFKRYFKSLPILIKFSYILDMIMYMTMIMIIALSVITISYHTQFSYCSRLLSIIFASSIISSLIIKIIFELKGLFDYRTLHYIVLYALLQSINRFLRMLSLI